MCLRCRSPAGHGKFIRGSWDTNTLSPKPEVRMSVTYWCMLLIINDDPSETLAKNPFGDLVIAAYAGMLLGINSESFSIATCDSGQRSDSLLCERV